MGQNNKDDNKKSKEKKGAASNNKGGGDGETARGQSVQAKAQSPARKTIAKKQKAPTSSKKVKSGRRRSVGSGGSAKLRKRKPKRTFKLSAHLSRAEGCSSCYCMDFFDRIASEAGGLSLISKKPTLSLRDMQSATKMVLRGELCLHALNEGKKAVKNIEMEGKTKAK
uniref:Histone H2B n=1 Tax=Meloidogyne javanica TaxID=6303 RepID=A0A915LPB0_MELJA